MTRPPCYDIKTQADCPRRYIGCKADCEKWHEYLAIHAAEKAEIERQKALRDDVEGFMVGQGKRLQRGNRAKDMRKGRM